MGEAARRRRMAGADFPGGFDVETGRLHPMKYAGQRFGAFIAETFADARSPEFPNISPRVPCGSCRECCWHPRVEILPERGDDPARYETERHDDGTLRLKKRADGA